MSWKPSVFKPDGVSANDSRQEAVLLTPTANTSTSQAFPTLSGQACLSKTKGTCQLRIRMLQVQVLPDAPLIYNDLQHIRFAAII